MAYVVFLRMLNVNNCQTVWGVLYLCKGNGSDAGEG